MAELKTKPTQARVDAFINAIADEQRRRDCLTLVKLMKQATKAEPKMWGGAIVGFGDYHYKYASGREGDWFLTGFSARKGNLSLYLMPGLQAHGGLLKKLGTHKTGKGCLYIKSLKGVDLQVLRELIARAVKGCKVIFEGKKSGTLPPP